jgi:hypothetical protein
MSMPTLLDIAKLNNTDAVVGLIEESIKAHPEISLGGARTIRGLNYHTKVRTGYSSVAFRNANEGTASKVSTFENRLVECYILNPRWECDKAIADAYEDGAQAYIAIEGAGMMEAAMRQLGTVFYYGTDGTLGDTKGFPGLLQMYDATNMVVDAGGTTATTGSSVWAVKFGPRDTQWVWGNNGSLNLSPVAEQRILDGSSNPLTAYVQEILARPGLQVGSLNSIARIKKITADSTKTLTDTMMFNLLKVFPTGITPDVFFMSRRSLYQLRASRTATNQTGAPAPIPTEVAGVPIHVTDSIVDTEALTI